MKKSILQKCGLVATVGIVAWAALADPIIQWLPFSSHNGGSGSGCPGPYTGYVKMTNSAGVFWLTPPTNATSCTFTDASGFASPYYSVTCVVRKSDTMTWCATNHVTFPVTNNQQYSLTVYIKNSPPPPTNGQPLNLQANWQ